jgi:hypothetical protein
MDMKNGHFFNNVPPLALKGVFIFGTEIAV